MARLLWREAQASRPTTALQTPTEFYRTFEAERVRTERTGSVFAVVTVNLAPEDRGGLQKCVETTQGLVRIYDTVGSLGSASVAVLLPETDPDGARSFADRLFTGLGNAGVRADLDVYSYPIDWEDEEEPPLITKRRRTRRRENGRHSHRRVAIVVRSFQPTLPERVTCSDHEPSFFS